MTVGRNNQRLLVTGANGFLGSEIVRQAMRTKIQVRATDRTPHSFLPGVEYRQANILDSDTLAPIFSGVDVVIHTAGLAHVFDRSKLDPKRFLAVNEQGTANVALAASQTAVRHLVVISSVSVYGDGTLGANEETICQPTGPYAESKLKAEQRAEEFFNSGDLQLTILRLATLYGEGDPGNVARLIRAIDRRRFIWIGNGANRKSLLYRGDAARACLAVVRSGKDAAGIYNVSAAPETMSTIIAELAAALGRSVPSLTVPATFALASSKIVAGLIGRHRAMGMLDLTLQKWLADDIYDVSKIRDKLQFKTTVDLAEGLRREVAWYRGLQNAT